MLLCLGDSLSALPGAWPERVTEPVFVGAVSGAKVRDLPTQLAAAPAAEATVISIGTNDVLNYTAPLELGALDAVVAAAPGRVALLTPMLHLPLHPTRYWLPFVRRRAVVRDALARTAGDVLDVRLPVTCWHRDGIHPNHRGHARIARAVDEWLRLGR